ncbi:MAG TPA: hypothetical protein VND93_16705 [Myxococcales bacterium]|nr:hypothetical protein [Myxococcales bacterium]
MTRRAKWAWGTVAAGAVLACAGSTREYSNNDLELAANHAAKDLCSCLFVSNMPEDFCRAYVKASPDVARFSVDQANKTVEASALVLWGARARYAGPHFGCTLE